MKCEIIGYYCFKKDVIVYNEARDSNEVTIYILNFVQRQINVLCKGAEQNNKTNYLTSP